MNEEIRDISLTLRNLYNADSKTTNSVLEKIISNTIVAHPLDNGQAGDEIPLPAIFARRVVLSQVVTRLEPQIARFDRVERIRLRDLLLIIARTVRQPVAVVLRLIGGRFSHFNTIFLSLLSFFLRRPSQYLFI